MTILNIFRSIAIKKSDHPLIITVLIITGLIHLAFYLIETTLTFYLSKFLIIIMVITASIHTYRLIERRLFDQQRQIQALIDTSHVLNLRAPLPSFTGWAATPELITQILIQIKTRHPTLVFELGSGASTIAIPYMLEKWGRGKLVSIDHNAEFGERTRLNLELHHHESVELGICELIPHDVEGQTYLWYDLSAIRLQSKIDIPIDDGPPWQTNPMARYPALPILWDQLADDALILVDDADREDETMMVSRWLESYPIDIVLTEASMKGLTILKVRKPTS